MATTRLVYDQVFDPGDVWNPGQDVEYIAAGHIDAAEFNNRLGDWNRLAIDPRSVEHEWVMLDRHRPGCDAPQPGTEDGEYDSCGCHEFGLYPVTDNRGVPVYFHPAQAGDTGATPVTVAQLVEAVNQ